MNWTSKNIKFEASSKNIDLALFVSASNIVGKLHELPPRDLQEILIEVLANCDTEIFNTIKEKFEEWEK